MTTWERSEELFCAYVRRRRQRRHDLVVIAYSLAMNEHSLRLIDVLAAKWKIEKQVLSAAQAAKGN